MQTDDINVPQSVIVQLFPFLKFVRDRWKIIATGAVLGTLVGIGILFTLPPMFEATAAISMAQVPRAGNGGTEPVPAFYNIEEPAVLIERLKLPSTYSEMALAVCRPPAPEAMTPEAMVRMVSVGVPRSANSVAVIRIRRDSPQTAEKCANALFEMIRSQQEAMAAPVEQDLQYAVVALEARLAEGQNELNRAEKKGRYQTLFFAKRDELLFLNQQIYSLHRAIQRITPAYLIAPVYASPSPVSPPCSLILTATTLAGFLLGFLMAGFRELSRWHTDSTGAPA
ncbi:hypothetical protein [Microvirgula aerodenitrificans]|uniref:hypothetical protein n=1 Tax=Microvirgula aerodenitrificans TaxID=57480 RepID=UPI00248F05BB|nr:hypothetical protein [Microvirgula aerodenitrificans]